MKLWKIYEETQNKQLPLHTHLQTYWDHQFRRGQSFFFLNNQTYKLISDKCEKIKYDEIHMKQILKEKE